MCLSPFPLLQAVSPVVATIGVGEKNRFRHPAPEVVRRFADLKIPLYRTDRDGAIEVDFDEKGLKIKTYAGARFIAPERSP